LSAWLKEQANDLPPLEETLQPVECKKIPVLDVDELRSFVFRRKDKVWVWIAMNREIREIVASACGDRTENTCRILWDRVPSAYKETIVFSDYWSAYRAVIPSEQQRPVGKETGKRLILNVGIIPYGNSWHASYVKRFLFPNVLKCMRFVENSSYTTIIPNYCRLLARYHFKNHHYLPFFYHRVSMHSR